MREKIHVSLARLEGYAEGGVWMAGPDLTAADIVAYPGLKLLLRASRRPEAVPLVLGLDGFETRFPRIACLDATGRAAARLREDLSAALAAGIAAGLLGERAAVAAVILSRADLIYCSVALLNRTSQEAYGKTSTHMRSCHDPNSGGDQHSSTDRHGVRLHNHPGELARVAPRIPRCERVGGPFAPDW